MPRKTTALPWVAPQLATLTDDAPAGDDWVHEIKYDGYRLMAQVTADGVRLLTRNQKDWTDRFQSIADVLARLKIAPALLDGEVAVEVGGGITSFQALQNALNDSSRGALQFFVFDALFLSGEDIRGLPLIERKSRLEKVLRRAPAEIRYSDHVVGRGEAFFERACKHHLEGIISKRASAPYRAGRGYDWLKVKCQKEQEFVIGGYTEPGGSRQGFGALHVGAYDGDGRLVYHGKVGTGFSDATLRQLLRRLAPLRREKSPFDVGTPRGAAVRGTSWIEPKLVAQIRYTEITGDGRLRHPAFLGLREDKPARQVRLEEVQPMKRATKQTAAKKAAAKKAAAKKATAKKATAKKATAKKATAKKASAKKASAKKASAKTARKTLGARPNPSGGSRNPADPTTKRPPAKQSKRETGTPILVHGVRLSSPKKVLYPDEGITKQDLAGYYELIAPWMLPHVQDRPLTLVRCPNGHTAWCFFQKHVDESAPEELGRVEVEERDKTDLYPYVHSLEGLLALVQMSALELHASNARRQQLEKPDRFVIDLDPDEGLRWRQVVNGAIHVRDLLTELGLRSFVKTTGGKGLHVVVPLQRRSDWDEVKAFSGAVAELLVRVAPKLYTTDIAKKKRTGKVLLDYLRNARGQTAVEAYSTRARPGAPVSAPLTWQELEDGAEPGDFTVLTMPDRVSKLKTDPWKEFGAVKQSLTAPMKRKLGL
jgi:bifunctional non-homologous end joining protein LigD